jgi:hypothetical protein
VWLTWKLASACRPPRGGSRGAFRTPPAPSSAEVLAQERCAPAAKCNRWSGAPSRRLTGHPKVAVSWFRMTVYTIATRSDRTGFDIEIVGSDGARQTMLGFKSRVEAQAWIVEDARLSGLDAAQFDVQWRPI